MNYFTFGNLDSRNYGVYVTASNMFDSPEEKVETIEIPYSNNIVHISEGAYKPFYVNLTCLMPSGLWENIDNFRNALLSQWSAEGMHRLIDSAKPNEFRLAKFKGPFTVRKTEYENMATFNLKFECKPQRYLVSGDSPITFTEDGDIDNPTPYNSKPFITIYGNGTLGIEGQTITVVNNAAPEHIDIDCESMQCYRGFTNMSQNVTIEAYEDFPVIWSGGAEITLEGGITRVDITPRWYTL